MTSGGNNSNDLTATIGLYVSNDKVKLKRHIHCDVVCQLHGELLYKYRHLSDELRRLEQCQSDAVKHLIQQTNTLTCISEHLRTAAI